MEHFIKFESKALGHELLELATAYKANPSLHAEKGKGKRVGCIFLNPSLRTRVSTQIAAQQLGMEAIVLNMDKEGWALEMQEGAIMNKGTVEHIKDAAGVLGSYFDILALRAFPSLTQKAAFDKLAVDNADQKASFDNQMAKATLDAGDMKASSSCELFFINACMCSENMEEFMRLSFSMSSCCSRIKPSALSLRPSSIN
jgi:aspartate carbamoyltransferase catalytic subunit